MPSSIVVLTAFLGAIGYAKAQESCMTPLHYAAEIGDSDKVSELLQTHDADLDDACEGKVRPLMLAAAFGNADVVALLLEAGAIPDVRHLEHGGTPLIGAAIGGHAEVVSLLLDNRAKVDQHDDLNLTALYYAAQNGHEETAKVLIEAGANLGVMGHTGINPWMVAKGNKHAGVAKALATAGAPHGPKHTTVYLTGGLPLPLENAKPFEDFLLGAYDFELLIGGGEQGASKMSIKERELTKSEASSLDVKGMTPEQREALEDEKRDAWRLTSLALTVPTPVYKKRGGRATRLWFDPSLAAWLISDVMTGATGAGRGGGSGGGEEGDGKWQEMEQYLRAEPLSPIANDPTKCESWGVRLVAHNRSSGQDDEKWVHAPHLSLTRGAEGEALWREQKKRGFTKPDVEEQARLAKEKQAKKDAAAAAQGETELEKLRKRAESHPALVSMIEKAQKQAEEAVAGSAKVQGSLKELEKKRSKEYTERVAQKHREAAQKQSKIDDEKVQQIFKGTRPPDGLRPGGAKQEL